MAAWLGLLAAAGAAIAFGVQYIPVKKYESKVYDGATFQWFMCSGILFAGVIVTASSQTLEQGCPPLVLLGGALWALSNYAVIPLVQLLGMSLGFSLYHFVNVVVGYCTGRFGLFGVKKLSPAFEGGLYFCDAGCVLVLISFVAMLMIESGEHKAEELEEAREVSREADAGSIASGTNVVTSCDNIGRGQSPTPELELGNSHADSSHVDGAEGPGNEVMVLDKQKNAFASSGFGLHGSRSFLTNPAMAHGTEPVVVDNSVHSQSQCSAEASAAQTLLLRSSQPAKKPLGPGSKRLLGGLLALVGGGCAGVQSVPATLYQEAHKEVSATATVLPQCLGIWLASGLIYLLYSSLAKINRWSVPHSVIRPAFFSGCIWTVGFALMITGIEHLGYTVGYTIDGVGPILVSSVLGIVVFKEITAKKQLLAYCAAELLQLVGVVLLASCGKGAA